MGRKKRNNASASAAANSPSHQHQLPPPVGMPYPLAYPPLMGGMMPPPMPGPPGADPYSTAAASSTNKRPRTDEGHNVERQTYPVKKYRPDSYYKSIEAFAKYTKSHRMLDAAYVKWTTSGATPEKPIVFGIRIAGSFLSWGKGKTRDSAIDAAIRGAFALVAAHGYDDYTLTDDCFTEEPVDQFMGGMPPPPPPPPPPMPGGMGMPPLPPGVPPPSFGSEVIPQPAAPKAQLTVASTVSASENQAGTSSVGLLLSTGTTSANPSFPPSKRSGGLVFDGKDVDGNGQEMSMEERRMKVPSYWNRCLRAFSTR